MGYMYSSSDHTFIVCAYGESPYLEECVRSLICQKAKGKVAISTSTPNEHIRLVGEKYHVDVLVNQGEPSISHDWNCAVEHCETPLLTIAHQDDCYDPTYVDKMLKSVNSTNSPLIFFSDYRELRQDGPIESNRLLNIKRILLSPLKIKSLSSSRFVRRRCISLGCSICCPSVTFALSRLPRPIFSEGYRSNLDWEAWERLSRFEGDFVYCPEILMSHRIHDDSETSHLIEDSTRTSEDLDMLKKFWPEFLARAINRLYVSGQSSNGA